ncbi:MAG: hypothetical protein NT051_02590 [Candidatus Micrarchaeota archaeon]|nr:hypothetical protein [Candidatus Micrarchaeota archaeon]
MECENLKDIAKFQYFAAVFASFVLAALFNTLIYLVTGVYLPSIFGVFAALYAVALIFAFTYLLSALVFKFQKKSAVGLAFSNFVIVILLSVGWNLVASYVGYPIGTDLAQGIPFAVAGVFVYFALLYFALPSEKSEPPEIAQEKAQAKKGKKR